ncbi:putative (R)-mandelonitrile lyase [Helianthus annuus]|nr:putative (R)-mandelonitrile lyase [Helianthus annuus]KAJ0934385.1 putative (R)-mandelonitrile lyase [Helianthus annuus]
MMNFQTIFHNIFLFCLLLRIRLQQVNCSFHHDSPPDSGYLRFTYEATDFSPAKAYDYIIIGGGTAGCPLAATLSESYSVLLLERGSSLNKSVLYESNFFQTLLAANDNDSPAQTFISEDGLQIVRARILGGGSMINGGFYSRADDYSYDNAGIEWDMRAVERAYEWVENSIVTHPARLNRFQTSLFNGLLESGVVPDSGFTFDHVQGTKIGGSTFNDSGIRHGAVELLNNANPENLDVLVHAMVDRVIFSTFNPLAAVGVVYHDSNGKYHEVHVRTDGEVILSAGAIGSPQLLLLSGLGPTSYLSSLNIPVVREHPFIGQFMADNPRTGIIGGKITRPKSKGSLHLLSASNVTVSPSVRFNYYNHTEDINQCWNAVEVIRKLLATPTMEEYKFGGQDFKFIGLPLPEESSDYETTASFCRDTLSTYWHMHGGCLPNKVVDSHLKVIGVDSLRVVDASTFFNSPGTNPQATIMMLGRYIGVKMLEERAAIRS